MVGDEAVDVEPPCHIEVDQARDLRSSAGPAEAAAGNPAPGDQQAGNDFQFLPLAGDSEDGAHPPSHAGRFDRLSHHVDAAGRLEGVVGAEPLRHVENLLHRPWSRLDDVGGAVGAGELPAARRRIDDDHRAGAADPAAGEGAEADQSGAEHDAGRSGFHLGPVHRRCEAGRQPAREQADPIERRITPHLRQRDLRHDGVLGEGAGPHEVTYRLAVTRQAGRPIGQVPFVLLFPDGGADVGAPAGAVAAAPAFGREEGHDMVAALDHRHPGADRLDDSGPLVPQHGGGIPAGIGPAGGVEIGVTDAAGPKLHQDLAVFRRSQVHLPNDQRFSERLQNCGAHLHCGSPS